MPTYEYVCDTCGALEEHMHTFSEMETAAHKCPKCETAMRRKITGGAGTIFRGDNWPSKELRAEEQDARLIKARRQAKHLKESGAVPWNEQIKQKDAGPLHDNLESDMRRREQEKLQSGQLDRDMAAAIKEEK